MAYDGGAIGVAIDPYSDDVIGGVRQDEGEKAVSFIHNGVFAQLPDLFVFSSGAGGWSTTLQIAEDGSFENTLAASYNAEVRKNIFFARARKYESALESSLHRTWAPAH